MGRREVYCSIVGGIHEMKGEECGKEGEVRSE